MADTLSTNVAEVTQELIAATMSLMPQKAPMISLVTRMNITKGHDRLEIPRVNSTSTVQTPTEGDEIVATSQFDLSSVTIQPTHRVIAVRVHERATYFGRDDIIALISEELAQSQAQDIDTDIIAEFANLGVDSTDRIGTTNTDITVALLRQARRVLFSVTRANGGPAPEPIYIVMSPKGEEDLMTNLGLQGVVSSTSPWIASGLSEDLIANYMIPQSTVVGLKMFRDGYITEDSNSDTYAAMFAKKALWLAMSKDWDMKTYDVPNWVGTILRSVADYNSGVGPFPRWGVRMLIDGA